MTKKFKLSAMILACVLTLAVVGSTVMSVMTFLKVNAMSASAAAGDENAATPDSVTTEDDVVIGENYTIRSTKNISDAYLSGDNSALSAADKETLKLASAVIDKVITASMNDYDKEKAIFTWMNETIRTGEDTTLLVNEDGTAADPHGVLKNHTAICVGYATTFRLFMQMLKIPCMVVHDTELVHSWDLVKIDGHWYHVDLYSASSETEPLTRLNYSDSMMLAQGSDWDRSFFPAADSLEKAYIYMNAKKAKDAYVIPNELKTALESDAGYVSLLIPDSEGAQDLCSAMLFTLEDRLMASEEYSAYSLSHTLSSAGNNELLVYISVYRYEEETDNGYSVSEEEQNLISSAITDAFGELTELSEIY